MVVDEPIEDGRDFREQIGICVVPGTRWSVGERRRIRAVRCRVSAADRRADRWRGRSGRRIRSGRSLPEALEGVGVGVHDPPPGVTHPIPRLASGDELPHGTSSGLLHRHSLGLGTIAQRCSFEIRESKGLRHDAMVSNRYHGDRASFRAQRVQRRCVWCSPTVARGA